MPKDHAGSLSMHAGSQPQSAPAASSSPCPVDSHDASPAPPRCGTLGAPVRPRIAAHSTQQALAQGEVCRRRARRPLVTGSLGRAAGGCVRERAGASRPCSPSRDVYPQDTARPALIVAHVAHLARHRWTPLDTTGPRWEGPERRRWARVGYFCPGAGAQTMQRWRAGAASATPRAHLAVAWRMASASHASHASQLARHCACSAAYAYVQYAQPQRASAVRAKIRRIPHPAVAWAALSVVDGARGCHGADTVRHQDRSPRSALGACGMLAAGARCMQSHAQLAEAAGNRTRQPASRMPCMPAAATEPTDVRQRAPER